MASRTYNRTIERVVREQISQHPIVLITGPRQVGKSTLSFLFRGQGYSYISFDDLLELRTARQDPQFFMGQHDGRIILDEIQRAPELFPFLEREVNRAKMESGDNSGLFILTGSQIYSSMQRITESLAGRVSIVRMSPLSRNEIIGREEIPLSFDVNLFSRRAAENPLSESELLEMIFRGGYPRLWEKRSISPSTYYANYVDTYLKRDISEILKIRDELTFSSFLQMLASLTGHELVYDSIAKAIGIDNKTVKSWIGVLSACGIVQLVQSYSDTSIVKRVVRRPKLYFTDTGLVCSLLRIDSLSTLRNSFFYGSIFETFVVNEILKSFRNNGIEPSLYYYRDTSQNEIDLVLVENASIHPIEIKAGVSYTSRNIRAFSCLENLSLPLGEGAIICTADKPYPVRDGVWAYPLAGL